MVPDPVIAPTIIRCTMHHNLTNGRIADVIVDVSLDEGVLGNRPVNAPTTATKVKEAWQDKICPQINAPITFTGMTWMDLDSMDSLGGSEGPNTGKPVNGVTARELPVPNTAVLVTKTCAHTRKQRTGRMYIPGPREDFIDSKGEIGGSYLTGYQTSVDDFKTAVNAIGAAFGVDASTAWRVVHRKFTSAGIPDGWESSDVVSAVVQARMATQRRRNRG